MKRILIKNAVIVNEGRKVPGSVVIEGEKIAEILVDGQEADMPCDETIDASGCYLLPGAIDEHVHFRDPGLTHKADITTESHAAAAGGVTSIMDMPNTNPQTTTLEALNDKLALLAEKSSVNFSCYFGATNNNYPLFSQLDKNRVCGVKLFMGSSTGNMLVDRMASLRNIFGGTDLLIAAHCEDQGIIKENTDKYKKEYGCTFVTSSGHPLGRGLLPFFRFGGTIGTRDQCASAYYAYFYCQRTEFILQSTFGREAYYCRSVCVSSNFYRRRLSEPVCFMI